MILTDVTNTIPVSEKRKGTDESSSENTKKKKIAGTVSQVMYEKLKRENLQLMKEIDMYRNNWMSKYLTQSWYEWFAFFFLGRPTGAVAAYFVEIGKILSGKSTCHDDEDEEDAGEQMERIKSVLNMSENELKGCEHGTDITKTCRSIVKHVYQDLDERAKMLVSSMKGDQLQAIQSSFLHSIRRVVIVSSSLCSTRPSRAIEIV